MAYDLTGKIKLIQEPQTFNSGFTKREMVVIVEDGKYPQEINLEFVQDKISLLDGLQPGRKSRSRSIFGAGNTTGAISTICRGGRSLLRMPHPCPQLIPAITRVCPARTGIRAIAMTIFRFDRSSPLTGKHGDDGRL
ncbi:DUF3127 domain-containing protein [Kineobactrum salinum]